MNKEQEKALEDALKKRCGFGVNLLEVKGDRAIFNYACSRNESQRYQIKFEAKGGEFVLAESSQKIVQEVLPPVELVIESSDPDPSIVGTPRGVLTENEKRIIYGIRFTPRKNQGGRE